MPGTTTSLLDAGDSAKRVLRRLLAVGENRLELLGVELQEEQDRLLQSVLLVLGIAAFLLLAALALSVAIAILLWSQGPVLVTGCLAALHLCGAWLLQRRLLRIRRNWRPFADSLDQLRKDRACLEKTLN
jgi:uncharacterized membrane protein YqjE